MRVLVADAPDRDDVFVEIHHGTEQWAEVALDGTGAGYIIKIWGPVSGGPWTFSLEDAMTALEQAKSMLSATP